MGEPAPETPRGLLILEKWKELLKPSLVGTAGEGVYFNASYFVVGHVYSVAVYSKRNRKGFVLSTAATFADSRLIHNDEPWDYKTMEEVVEHLSLLAFSAGWYKGEVWAWSLTNPVRILEQE